MFFAKFAGKDHKNILRAPLFLLFWDFLGTFLDFFALILVNFVLKNTLMEENISKTLMVT